jgi:uncharacterized protein (TIGR03435 family)
MATYALVAASQTLGPRLRASEIDQAACDARRTAIQRREPVPLIAPGAKPVCGTGRTAPGMITAIGWKIDALATAITPFVNRVVSDRTHLIGLYDFDLKWTPDTLPRLPAGAPADQPFTFNGVAIDQNGPSLFTALKEQLGLKLESAKGLVDVVAIDRVEHPTPD